MQVHSTFGKFHRPSQCCTLLRLPLISCSRRISIHSSRSGTSIDDVRKFFGIYDLTLLLDGSGFMQPTLQHLLLGNPFPLAEDVIYERFLRSVFQLISGNLCAALLGSLARSLFLPLSVPREHLSKRAFNASLIRGIPPLHCQLPRIAKLRPE